MQIGPTFDMSLLGGAPRLGVVIEFDHVPSKSGVDALELQPNNSNSHLFFETVAQSLSGRDITPSAVYRGCKNVIAVSGLTCYACRSYLWYRI
jgi:hypothetical protein